MIRSIILMAMVSAASAFVGPVTNAVGLRPCSPALFHSNPPRSAVLGLRSACFLFVIAQGKTRMYSPVFGCLALAERSLIARKHAVHPAFQVKLNHNFFYTHGALCGCLRCPSSSF